MRRCSAGSAASRERASGFIEANVSGVGCSFGVPNLLICDNSVFPSALPANPALTIMAPSLRTVEAMLAGR